MENITKIKVLKSIGKVYEQAQKSKLEDSFFESIEDELNLLSNYFKVSESQAFFISMAFALTYQGNSVNFDDLIKYFDCNPMKILEYSEDFEYLFTNGIYERQATEHSVKTVGLNEKFFINKKITEAVLHISAMPKVYQKRALNIIELLEDLSNFGQQREDGVISTIELFKESKKIISENSALPLIEKIDLFNFESYDTYLYLLLIWEAISGNESVSIAYVLEKTFDKASERINYLQSLLLGENALVKNDLIEIEEAVFFKHKSAKLTETSHKLLNDCNIKLFSNKKKKDNVIIPSEIDFRELIFDMEEMQQLAILQNLLKETNFKETQNRLADKGLPKGIAALLHGAPGTGKTEIVKQLGKATNREIIKVEISEAKSKWFGESQKNIKRIFTDYNSYAKDCERTPILLFNEADAIISKRIEDGRSNADQTQNSIQNILLEELENFNGILIATTNLVSNLDKAFERRFLFKVPFQKPSIPIRAKIWKSKFSYLKDENCRELAEKFDFSGGQIENIARKKEINEILNDSVTKFEEILLFCNEESIVPQNNKIGFTHFHQ